MAHWPKLTNYWGTSPLCFPFWEIMALSSDLHRLRQPLVVRDTTSGKVQNGHYAAKIQISQSNVWTTGHPWLPQTCEIKILRENQWAYYHFYLFNQQAARRYKKKPYFLTVDYQLWNFWWNKCIGIEWKLKYKGKH